MMMLNAIIVDDKPANIDTLGLLIEKYCPEVRLLATATSIEEAHPMILQHRPDLIFLDIELYDGTGFDLLRRFKDVFFETIFTTAYDQYALQAFRERALDYLLKPIQITQLQEAVARAGRHIALKRKESIPAQLPHAPAGKISLPSQDGYIFVEEQHIVRCEASGSYTIFYLSDKRKIVVSLRLKICESRLPASCFIRIHHSHIVNSRYVVGYQRGKTGTAILSDGTEIEVSASRKDAFLRMMNLLV